MQILVELTDTHRLTDDLRNQIAEQIALRDK